MGIESNIRSRIAYKLVLAVAAAAAAAGIAYCGIHMTELQTTAAYATSDEPVVASVAEELNSQIEARKAAASETEEASDEADEEASKTQSVEPSVEYDGANSGSMTTKLTLTVEQPVVPEPEPEPEPEPVYQGPASYDFGYAPYSDNPAGSNGLTDWHGYGFYLAHSDTYYGQLIAGLQIGDLVTVNGKTVTIQGRTTAAIGSDESLLFAQYGYDTTYFGTCTGDGYNIWVLYGA